ncbi:sodium:solute symporter family transporter [Planctomicrobium sp. SH527]|uniref:sodium:solute symporter family transporter n=1 Tax=Planctomicrobium sp. SH527 TaxID=3448123 RepID=UPI003F5B1FDB
MSEAELTLQSSLSQLDYVAIILYLLTTFGIALWFGSKQHSSEDFFVGGRRVPWFAVGLSILATLFSTLTYLGSPGEVVKHGVWFFCGYLSVPLSAYVVTRIWIPFYMRLELTSAYSYLELRFNYSIRIAGAWLFIFLRLGWMSMVIFAASMALDRVKGPDLEILPGPDLYWWMGIIGVIAAIYSVVGGIQAVIWTDVLQCLLLVSGAFMVIASVMYTTGTAPVDWWTMARTEATHHKTPPLFSLDLTIRVTIITAMINHFFWTISTHCSDQVVLQRYFSTESISSARRSYFINIGTDIFMVSLLATCGFALLAFYSKNPQLLPEGWTVINSADKLFPHFLSNQLPAGCAGLIISAFLCDAIQTLEAGVNSITAVASTDLLSKRNERLGKKDPSLLFVRVLCILITMIVTINAGFVAYLALNSEMTIFDLMPKFFNMFVGPLAALFIIGMFFPRCTGRSVSVAIVVGLTVSVLWSWGKQIFQTSVGPTILLSVALPLLTTVLTAWLLSFIVESRQPHPGQSFTWRAVLQRPLKRTEAHDVSADAS